MVVDPDGLVLRSSARATALGLVNRTAVTIPDIVHLIERVAVDGHAREQEMRVRRPPLGRELLELRVRVAALGTGAILVLIDDLAEERRVDVVRRDFVSNVSHELKTPVGALSLLARYARQPAIAIGGQMLYNVAAACFTLQGLAFVNYLQKAKGTRPGLRGITLAVLALILSQAAMILGVFEQFSDARKLRRPQPNQPTDRRDE